jgi:hypothetical protein
VAPLAPDDPVLVAVDALVVDAARKRSDEWKV